MIANDTLGQVRGPSTNRCEYLALVFSPSSVPLRARWRNNGLSADFLGDYVTTFLPLDEETAEGLQETEIRHSVTYVANELLENAMKYHDNACGTPIGLRMELAAGSISVSANNGVSGEQAARYRGFIDKLQSEDPNEQLLRQWEANAKDGGLDGSRLGLLTMITDYGAELSWRFENHPDLADRIIVTTTAVLSLRKPQGGLQ